LLAIGGVVVVVLVEARFGDGGTIIENLLMSTRVSATLAQREKLYASERAVFEYWYLTKLENKKWKYQQR
jgi:hypothetical protein